MSARRRRARYQRPVLRDLAIPLVMTTVMFIMGIVFGSVGSQTLDQIERSELVTYLSRLGQSLTDSVSTAPASPQRAILTNLQRLAIVWILAVTVVGSPAILLVVFLQGFASGFTVAILVEEWSIKGLALALASVVPHNALLVSGLLFAGSAGLAHAWTVGRSIVDDTLPPFWQRLGSFSLVCLFCSVLLILAGLVESYVSPFLAQKVAPFVF